MSSCRLARIYSKGHARLVRLARNPEFVRDFGRRVQGRRRPSGSDPRTAGGNRRWDDICAAIAELDDDAVRGVEALFEMLGDDNKARHLLRLFHKDMFQDHPGDLNKLLKLFNRAYEAAGDTPSAARDKGLNQLADALSGNLGIQGTWYQLHYLDDVLGGDFRPVQAYEVTRTPLFPGTNPGVSAGPGGIDAALQPGFRPRWFEFKSGPTQRIDDDQFIRHLDRVVRSDWREFRYVLQPGSVEPGRFPDAWRALFDPGNASALEPSHLLREAQRLWSRIHTDITAPPPNQYVAEIFAELQGRVRRRLNLPAAPGADDMFPGSGSREEVAAVLEIGELFFEEHAFSPPIKL